jgi:superfamily I DNA/RNA helicase
MNPTRPPITLSEAQREVVETRGRHLQVMACAGSGKTESVSRRVAELIREGVASHEIVAFTFTDRDVAALGKGESLKILEPPFGQRRSSRTSP